MIIFRYGLILGGHFYFSFVLRHMACNMKKVLLLTHGMNHHYRIMLVEFNETIHQNKERITCTLVNMTLHFCFLVSDSCLYVILLVIIQSLLRGKGKSYLAEQNSFDAGTELCVVNFNILFKCTILPIN